MADCNLTDICLALLKIKDNNFLTETILLSPWGNSLLGLPQRTVRLQELVAGQQQQLTAHGCLQCEQLCSAEPRGAVGTARGRGEPEPPLQVENHGRSSLYPELLLERGTQNCN